MKRRRFYPWARTFAAAGLYALAVASASLLLAFQGWQKVYNDNTREQALVFLEHWSKVLVSGIFNLTALAVFAFGLWLLRRRPPVWVALGVPIAAVVLTDGLLLIGWKTLLEHSIALVNRETVKTMLMNPFRHCLGLDFLGLSQSAKYPGLLLIPVLLWYFAVWAMKRCGMQEKRPIAGRGGVWTAAIMLAVSLVPQAIGLCTANAQLAQERFVSRSISISMLMTFWLPTVLTGLILLLLGCWLLEGRCSLLYFGAVSALLLASGELLARSGILLPAAADTGQQMPFFCTGFFEPGRYYAAAALAMYAAKIRCRTVLVLVPSFFLAASPQLCLLLRNGHQPFYRAFSGIIYWGLPALLWGVLLLRQKLCQKYFCPAGNTMGRPGHE